MTVQPRRRRARQSEGCAPCSTLLPEGPGPQEPRRPGAVTAPWRLGRAQCLHRGSARLPGLWNWTLDNRRAGLRTTNLNARTRTPARGPERGGRSEGLRVYSRRRRPAARLGQRQALLQRMKSPSWVRFGG